MSSQVTEMNEVKPSACYLDIQDEVLCGLHITRQSLISSRIQLSSYHQLAFSDCVFYGTEFQEVTFIDCHFENCSFIFSHFRKCLFINCQFSHCNWQAASSVHSNFQNCELDPHLSQLTEVNGNQLVYRFTEDLAVAS